MPFNAIRLSRAGLRFWLNCDAPAATAVRAGRPGRPSRLARLRELGAHRRVPQAVGHQRRIAIVTLAEGVIVMRAGGWRRLSARSITLATRSGPPPSSFIGPS